MQRNVMCVLHVCYQIGVMYVLHVCYQIGVMCVLLVCYQIGVMCVLLVCYQIPPATANTTVPTLHTLTTASFRIQVSRFHLQQFCLSVRLPHSSTLISSPALSPAHHSISAQLVFCKLINSLVFFVINEFNFRLTFVRRSHSDPPG